MLNNLPCPGSVIDKIRSGQEQLWINPDKRPFFECENDFDIPAGGIKEASDLLSRFAPLITYYFPETKKDGGIIESPISEINKMRDSLVNDTGRLFLKEDSELAVAGSVKARGGIYEVLRHTEDLALESGILSDIGDDHLKLTSPQARQKLSEYKIQVGSTGNLGLSIGIMSAALGYKAIVHMSADAKQWKKDLLRKRGAEVIEYGGDYSLAVKNGRIKSDADPKSYFVDDERSVDLFLGYAVAGERLKKQLEKTGVIIDNEHQLFVYLPCGVGGAPGGITYGLKSVYGDNVHCFFAEPTGAPCMLLGLETGLFDKVSISDMGLSGKTLADGLAVGRASALVSKAIRHTVSGEATVDDDSLLEYMKLLFNSEGKFIEPSACAAFGAYKAVINTCEGQEYLNRYVKPENRIHMIWATGGGMVPEEIKRELLS